MRIGLLVAMEMEREQILHFLKIEKEEVVNHLHFFHCSFGGNQYFLADSGIGEVNASIATLELIRSYSPDFIITSGVAGGIDASLNVMDVVVGERVAYHDVYCGFDNDYGQVQGLPLFYKSDERLLRLIDRIKNQKRVHKGLICSGNQFISDPKELRKIKEHFPEGMAVEMETGGIAQTCYLYRIPFISFRIISDIPGVKNHPNTYQNFWKELANQSFEITKEFLEAIPTTL